LSKEQARKLILEREQYFVDTFKPVHNILKTAGSRLGMEISDETKEKLSKALSGSKILCLVKLETATQNLG
ncbi:hypothetical protein BX616_000238, partial [Lobosporangium transversale]